MIIFHLKCYILIDENQSIDRYYITLYIRFNFENNHFSSQIETMLLYFNRQLTKISFSIDRSIDRSILFRNYITIYIRKDFLCMENDNSAF